MFNKIKSLFANKPAEIVPEKSKKVENKSRPEKNKKELSEKEKATLADVPYINILKVEINPDNINDGAFELDWNDKFVINLIKAGYKYKETDTDNVIVDRWFQNVCRNVALEMYEQLEADPSNRSSSIRSVYTKDIGNGRTEVG